MVYDLNLKENNTGGNIDNFLSINKTSFGLLYVLTLVLYNISSIIVYIISK